MNEHPATLHVEEVFSKDAVAQASVLFDDPVDPRATDHFLSDERHHLLIGYVGGRPAGFVTAVELLHPDKPEPEMFVYEIGRGRSVPWAGCRHCPDA
jgi:hypothetical protein